MVGNSIVDSLKFGERSDFLESCQSRAKLSVAAERRCRDCTGDAWALTPPGEETVQTTNALDQECGGESRSGMNPGVGGSNPLADTTQTNIPQFTAIS
ncbi:hypothetical protein GFGA_1c0923 [Gluconobacter frateurii NBRC 103465]|nr:hypothetical protein GFGA_1c0923 [Gluconobacter frateurii NBRC 103465]